MTEQKQQPEHENTRGDVEIVAPERTISLTADTKESDRHECGAERVRGVFPGKKIPRELAVAMTQRCYVLPAGGKTKLKVAFFEGTEKASPKGTLVIEPKRGKVSPSRIELDGSKHEIVVDYTAPDETVRVSVRAMMPGFARGKVHLHLE
jgi:hypothetical protein